MEDLIRFYLLEQPRSVSDMIEELTSKELSDDAGKRSDEIPHIAGNWFREDSGYLWRLQDKDLIKDQGRQYAVDRDTLVEGLLSSINAQQCFSATEVRGEDAELDDAYSHILPDMTLRDLKSDLKEEVFTGPFMKELFDFQRWKDSLLSPETAEGRIASYRLELGFWPSVHFILLSTILASRKRHITETLEKDEEHYFEWRSRRQALEDSQEALQERLVHEHVPGTEKEEDGTFVPERTQKLVEGFQDGPEKLKEDSTEILANLYLLSLNDGVELFNQYSRYDHDINLFFNLMERGWMVRENSVKRDERTGNIVVPLGEVRSYLHDLAALPHHRSS